MRFPVLASLVVATMAVGLASPEAGDVVVPDPIGSLDGEAVSRAAFEGWLLEIHGPPNIAPFFDELAIVAGAEKLGVVVPPPDVEAALDREWAFIVRERFNGDESKYLAELLAIGHSKATYRNARRHGVVTDLTIERAARASRAVDDAALEARLADVYGDPPMRRVVRVLFVDRRKPHPEDAPADAADDRAGRTLAAKARIERALARCAAGEDFGAVLRELSDDESAADGGVIAPFRAESHFNGALDAAVLALTSNGERSSIVETRTGFAIVQLDSSDAVTFPVVREELKRIVLDEPVLPEERELARRKLLDQVTREIRPLD